MRRIATDQGEDSDTRAVAAVALQALAPGDFARVARAVVLDDDEDDDAPGDGHQRDHPRSDHARRARCPARCARSTPPPVDRGSSTAPRASSPRPGRPAARDPDGRRGARRGGPGRPVAPRRAAAAAARGAPVVRRRRRVRRGAGARLGDGGLRDGRPARTRPCPRCSRRSTPPSTRSAVAAAARAARGVVAPVPALAPRPGRRAGARCAGATTPCRSPGCGRRGRTRRPRPHSRRCSSPSARRAGRPRRARRPPRGPTAARRVPGARAVRAALDAAIAATGRAPLSLTEAAPTSYVAPVPPGAREVAAVALEDQQGRRTTFGAHFRGRRHVVAFFYTRCGNPAKCSATVTRLAALATRLPAELPGEEVGVAGISYDPGVRHPRAAGRLRRGPRTCRSPTRCDCSGPPSARRRCARTST